MADAPWLTIIGLGEDGPEGLAAASRKALGRAEIVMGARRHLSLLPDLDARTIEWPVPFAEGIPVLLGLRGRDVVLLASGDPFWFGAGTSVTRHLEPGEWVAHSALSAFGLAASRMGWPLESTACLGLHAAPLTCLRPYLFPGARCIALLRDGAAATELARWLSDVGFGASALHVMEALGGPRERIRKVAAGSFDLTGVAHPVAAGLEIAGDGIVLPRTGGLPDNLFDHDGQITKRPMRALTLSTLAPRPGELLWDIGSGSGAVGIEWLLAHPASRAIAIESDPDRVERIRENAVRLGADRLRVMEARAPEGLAGLPEPSAVFIGGGLSEPLLSKLWAILPEGTRVVANAVTLESEALLVRWQGMNGGNLLRIALSRADVLGSRRGWKAARPVVQWSVAR